jgi:DNA repair exonuclease SbcCD ATPase subunit
VNLQKQLEEVDDEASELLRLARRRTIRQDRLDASMAEVEREQERVREEMESVRAQIASRRAPMRYTLGANRAGTPGGHACPCPVYSSLPAMAGVVTNAVARAYLPRGVTCKSDSIASP